MGAGMQRFLNFGEEESAFGGRKPRWQRYDDDDVDDAHPRRRSRERRSRW